MSRDLTKYMPLLNKIAGAFPSKYRDDLIQEGYLALHRAAELFDESRGVNFESYAYKEVFGTMNRFVRDNSNTVSLDNTITDDDGEQITYADIIPDEVDVAQEYEDKEYYDKHMAQASPIDRFIKERHFEWGMTPKEIIELYGELHMIQSVSTIKKILKK